MAGLGKKTFTAGDVLIAGDVNSYLMDQTVMNFATVAARSSAIPVPSTGMVSYVGDTGSETPTTTIPQIEAYTGAAWQTPYGMTLLTSSTFTAATSVSINNVFTTAYDNYVITVTGTSSADLDIGMRLRASGTDVTSASYQSVTQRLFIGGGTPPTASNTGGVGQTSMINTFGLGNGRTSAATVNVFRPFTSDPWKSITATNAFNHSGVNVLTANMAGSLNSSTLFDGFTFILVSAGSITGTLRVYGLRNA
jgi:hypothetical protein